MHCEWEEMRWKDICSSCMVQTSTVTIEVKRHLQQLQTSLLVTATIDQAGYPLLDYTRTWKGELHETRNLYHRSHSTIYAYTLHALHSIPAWNLWVDLKGLMHGHNPQLHQCINTYPCSRATHYSTQHLPIFVYCTKLSVTQHKHKVLKQVIFNLPRQ